MKKYYLHNGNEQQGLFDIQELKEKKITKDTPVWYEGLPDWTPAGKVEELKHIFNVATPPPFGNKQSSPPPPPLKNEARLTPQEISPVEKKSNAVGIVLTIIGALGAIVVITAIVINNNKHSSTQTDPQTYQEKVMTVEEMERADPAKFLDASGTYNENFWGTAMKVHGKVTNSATVANYKDIVIEITFYSETKTALDRKRYTLYEYVPAHSSKTFEWKIDRPQACKKLGWDVVSATAY